MLSFHPNPCNRNRSPYPYFYSVPPSCASSRSIPVTPQITAQITPQFTPQMTSAGCASASPCGLPYESEAHRNCNKLYPPLRPSQLIIFFSCLFLTTLLITDKKIDAQSSWLSFVVFSVGFDNENSCRDPFVGFSNFTSEAWSPDDDEFGSDPV